MDIWVHEDKQLEELLNETIISREKLHQWPLSYVEKVSLKNGSYYIYKSQNSASSVEKEFYSKIKAPFLTSPIYSGTYENCDILILPYLDFPTLGEVSDIELDQIVMGINSNIQNIPDMPIFFDLSSVEKLAQIIDSVCIIFEEKGECQNIINLKKWIKSNAHACYSSSLIGTVHGDLTSSNILVDNGKIAFILDWQRPMKAPVLLEGALSYRLAGYDAVRKYGDFGILALICFFLWYSYACKKFMPFVYNVAHKYLLEFISLVK